VAQRFGIGEERSATYHSDHEGTALNYDVLSDAVISMRRATPGRPVGRSWKERIEKDFKNRKKNTPE